MILVTGANGFLGSWLVSLLEQKGYFWHGLCQENSDLTRLINLPESKISCDKIELWTNFILRSKPKIIVSCDWEGVGNNLRNEKLI